MLAGYLRVHLPSVHFSIMHVDKNCGWMGRTTKKKSIQETQEWLASRDCAGSTEKSCLGHILHRVAMNEQNIELGACVFSVLN